MPATLPAYVVDLSEDPIVVGQVDSGHTRVCTELGRQFPFRVAVRDLGDTVEVIAGPPCNTLVETKRQSNVLIFDQLGRNLPTIGDVHIQQGILAGFWHALRPQLATLAASQSLDPGARPACDCYLIVPTTYPVGLLNTLQTVLSTNQDTCHFRGSLNALLCTLTYYSASPLLAEHVVENTPTVVTIIEACSARDIRLLQMQCLRTPTAWYIRPLYQTRGSLGDETFNPQLRTALQQDAGTDVYLVQTADDGQRLKAALDSVLPKRGTIFWRSDAMATCHEVKVRGAMRLVQCFRGEHQSTETVYIEQYRHFGVDFGTGYLHIVIAQDTLAALGTLPFTQSRTFQMQGPLSHSLRLQLGCGYSESATEVLWLGQLELDLAHVKGLVQFEVAVAWTLDTLASGTVALFCVLPGKDEPTLVDTMSFQLPPMVA